jgi:hypothetical protein
VAMAAADAAAAAAWRRYRSLQEHLVLVLRVKFHSRSSRAGQAVLHLDQQQRQQQTAARKHQQACAKAPATLRWHRLLEQQAAVVSPAAASQSGRAA